MNETLIAILSALAGFLGKSSWDLYWKRKIERERISHQKRLDFLERQLTEFYWPLFFQLQKNGVVFNSIMNSKDTNDALSAQLDYDLDRNYFYPNNEEMAKIIETKYYLAQPDEELEKLLMRFLRHQAVFTAIRKMGLNDKDPIRFGEPWPNGLYEAVEKKTKILQEEFDREIGRNIFTANQTNSADVKSRTAD
jgi:hypothetical protein